MPVGARKDTMITCVSTSPDWCRTQAAPVPYPILTTLEGSDLCIDSVRFNKKPVYVYDHSLAPTVYGDEPGKGGGVLSQVNEGKVWAVTASGNVRAGGRPIVRVGDKNWMNLQK